MRLVLVVFAVLVAVPTASAQVFGGRPQPTTVATSFRANALLFGERKLLSWQGPERYAERPGTSLSRRPTLVERDGRRLFARFGGAGGVIERRLFAAEPDAFSYENFPFRYVSYVLARAGGGNLRLVGTTLGGTPAWRARFAVRANDCAGLARGTVTVWLARATLLPLRVDERRGQRRTRDTLAYRDVNVPLPLSDFRDPDVGARPDRRDYGFRRAAPAVARPNLSYRPHLPTRLPSGFTLAVTGWAPRSGVTGAEGSNAPYRELFGAVYRRGHERIDVTQRLSRPGGFRNDPFGGECLFQHTERVRIGGSRATFGIGPETTPHLYWRRTRVLFTVSGSLPRRDLAAIARSLAPATP